MYDEQLKGEIRRPRSAAEARAHLDELLHDEPRARACIKTAWSIAIEIAAPMMSPLELGEDPEDKRPLGKDPPDFDEHDLAERLLGNEANEATVHIVGDSLGRLPLLLLDRRIRRSPAAVTWLTAALAPYVYDLCICTLEVSDLTPTAWALSEIAFNYEPKIPTSTDDWLLLTDKWGERKRGYKEIPVAFQHQRVLTTLAKANRRADATELAPDDGHARAPG